MTLRTPRKARAAATTFVFSSVLITSNLMHAEEGPLEGVEGGRVEHLLLDLGRIRTPGHQEQLLLLAGLGGALALVRVLKIKHPVPTKQRRQAEENKQD